MIMIDGGHLHCKVVGVFEHRVLLEAINDHDLTNKTVLTIPGANFDGPLIQESELNTLLNFIELHPEIEFVSLPRVRDAHDVIQMR